MTANYVLPVFPACSFLGYRYLLLPHLEAGTISQEDAVAAFVNYIQVSE